MFVALSPPVVELWLPLGILLLSLAGAVFVFKKNLPPWVRLLVCLTLLFITGRTFTLCNAISYGLHVRGTFVTLGRTGFADTAVMDEWFASSYLMKAEARATALPFLGGRYADRIDDLKTGIHYFSTQMTLAPAARFQAPPSLHVLHLDTSDPREEGMVRAVLRLISDYNTFFP